jgi:hypothetical protein
LLLKFCSYLLWDSFNLGSKFNWQQSRWKHNSVIKVEVIRET